MDGKGFAPARRRFQAPPDHFLSVYPPAPARSSTPEEEAELNEEDIFSAVGVQSPTANSRCRRLQSIASISAPPDCRLHSKGLNSEQSGVLVALSESERPNSHFYQKSSLSSSSSSAASSPRFIPKLHQERFPVHPPSFTKLHPQSAPVNVPVMKGRRRSGRGDGFEFDDLDEENTSGGDGDHEMLPPHEVVARSQSSAVACSVLEGVGRTLKGRDLRRVRNAVWHSTGFLD